jgi:hypothetical protein
VNLRVFALTCALFAVAAAAAADELDDSLAALKDAQAKKDVELIKKLSAETSALARKAIETPAPTAADEKEAWTAHVTYAKNVQVQADYIVYATAVQSPPATLIDLMGTLEQENPKSRYLDEGGYATWFAAMEKTGATAKVVPIAEKALANFPGNEDLLAVLANDAATKQQNDKALTYANRLTAALSKRAKPEGMPAADWERKRGELLGRGYWLAGVIYGEKNAYMNTDKSLRSALPYIKGNPAMMGPALYWLGFANYKLGMMTNSKAKVLEGAQFSEQSAAIQGPYQQPAFRNSLLMKTDAGKMR